MPRTSADERLPLVRKRPLPLPHSRRLRRLAEAPAFFALGHGPTLPTSAACVISTRLAFFRFFPLASASVA